MAATAAVVSVSMGVMKPVLAKLTTLMGDKYKKIKGLRKKVTFLQRELGEMDTLLDKMDGADELDPQAKKWRKDIIEMSYNIEDSIDDFMQRVGEADNKAGILRKAFKYLETFKDRWHMANQFEEITKQVMEASERRKRYTLDQNISITAPVDLDPRLSAIYEKSASLVGISAQKDELVNWATNTEQQLKVMAIVGIGGLGKTTLANEVYRKIGGKFDCKAFVSVSQKPEMIGLFNSLLSQLGLGTHSHACNLQDAINKLREHLQDKRYFIVVDDLWDTGACETRVWNTIQYAFPENDMCSRVMVTTRIENVARSCCRNNGFIHNMRTLSEHDSRKLFFDRIFGSEDACPSELRRTSCKILKKCGGLPLAIITMASMLACQQARLEEQWESVNISFAKLETNSNYKDMMHILDLSYKNLPRHLKACFLYLGSYPEDHVIGRMELIQRWVAEGFVSTSAGEDVWYVAESYFNELVNRNMIQPIYYDYIGVYCCKVHDMLLELIVRRCKEDNFLRLVNGREAVIQEQDEVIRRLICDNWRRIQDGKLDITIAGKLSQIRSLAILEGSEWTPPLLEFKFLRVLFLENYSGQKMDLTCINQLQQLRYLKVEDYHDSTVLPGQIRVMPLLETLDIRGHFNENISLEIPDVGCLYHLNVQHGTRLPGCIGKAKSLRTLWGFSLSTESLEGIIGLGELTALSHLHLDLSQGRARLPKAAWMAALGTSLQKLRNLKQLDMSSDGPLVSLHADDALSSLSPSFGNLERLYLQNGFTFSRVPGWIGHLHKLLEVSLGVKQVFQEDVDIIGTRLASLKRLNMRIEGVPTEMIVIGGSTGFPAVEWFRFECNGTSRLTFEAGAMPELRNLWFVLDADEWDKAAPGGLQHLPSLKNIRANRVVCHHNSMKVNDKDKKEAEAVLIRGVFQEVVDALPTRPEFKLEEGILLTRRDASRRACGHLWAV